MTKLRAILLLKPDFYGMNKIVFNNRVIPSLKTNQAIPCKVIEGKKW